MSNIDKGQYVYSLLKKGLDAGTLRSKVISNNIANVNTKNYKAYHVKFEDNLNDSVDSLHLKVTQAAHIKDSSANGDAQIVQDKDVSMNQDGNSVDIDNEMADQATNTLNYLTLTTEINNRLEIQKFIISDGRK